ncbi:3,9-dihydroxypterocarpan 6A-monooxygenase-like [Euphorbia lathyris]|uniref:3,9-dihydroxypterocarpan 6A-monooxygenase-like n=1 Tax=Euphorbia lathyris TaxID=212925 RepID=UPI0033132B72
MDIMMDLVYYCAIFLIWIISALLIRPLMKKLVIRKHRPPPGPTSLPIIGHLHLLSSSFPQSLKALAQRYGPLMKIRLAGNDVVVVSDAKTAKYILKTHDVDFASKYILGFGLAKFNIYDGDSFINSEYGAYWRSMKKLCKTELFGVSQLERFSHIREEETCKLLKYLVMKSEDGETCDLSQEIASLANNIICKMILGKRCEENPNLAMEVRKLIRKIMECSAKMSFSQIFGPLNRLDISGNGKRLVLALQEYDELIEELFTQFQDSGEQGKDVADMLLHTYSHSHTNAQLNLTKNKIKTFLMEIFMAGVDTTAATIQWAIAELLSNPNILNKVREEIKKVVGSKRVVRESDIENLPYLEAVVKETLRKHPPGPLIRRECMIDTKINGYDIRKGTKVIINAYAIMQDPQTFEEPDKFKPGRFLVDLQEMDFQGNDHNFIPFGSGRRACIGASHGLIVTNATIASLIQCFDFKLKDGDKIEMELTSGYSGATALPLVCYPINRFHF